MNKVVTTIIDRLVERWAVLIARLISSRVEGLHAESQAGQQSQLEDLARQYESDGKAEIAATLRQRAAKLTAADLAVEAVETICCLNAPGSPASEPSSDLRTLPDFTSAPEAARKSRRKPTPIAPVQDVEATP